MLGGKTEKKQRKEMKKKKKQEKSMLKRDGVETQMETSVYPVVLESREMMVGSHTVQT